MGTAYSRGTAVMGLAYSRGAAGMNFVFSQAAGVFIIGLQQVFGRYRFCIQLGCCGAARWICYGFVFQPGCSYGFDFQGEFLPVYLLAYDEVMELISDKVLNQVLSV